MIETVHTIHLHGKLKQFGTSFRFAVNSPLEAAQFLVHQVDGFFDVIKEGCYRLVEGPPNGGLEYAFEDMWLTFGSTSTDFHFIPIVEGAGSGSGGGIGKIVVGALIAVVSIIAAIPTGGASLGAGFSAIMAGTAGWAGTFAVFGASLMLAGVAALLQPTVNMGSVGGYQNAEAADARPSFLMTAPVNMMEQGGAVPVLFGRFMCGSNVINGSLMPEAMPVDA